MTGETTPFDVLYRDRDVIVANKRPGLLSQPDAGGDPDLLSLLSREYGGPVYPVHRLDRGVGGLIAVASSERAARVLSAQVAGESDAFRKEYLTVVHGRFDDAAGEMTDFLLRDAGRTRTVPEGTKGAKRARLAYRVLAESGEGASDPRAAVGRRASRRGRRQIRRARPFSAARALLVPARVSASRDGEDPCVFGSAGDDPLRLVFDPRSRGERFF